MQIQDEIEKLTRFYPVLGRLPAGLQRALLDASYPVQSARGEILFDVDETIRSLLLLTEGSVRAILPGKERELLLYRVQPGACCAISISHLLGNTRYGARAEVETAVRGVALPQALFREIMDQSPVFNEFILRAFSERFTQLLDLIGRVTSMRLDERLARMLVTQGPVIRATHTQLADDLGSVREVISRILKEFEAKGWIKLARGQIEVLDPVLLRDLACLGDPGHRQP